MWWSGCYDNNPWDPTALNIFPFLIWKPLSRCVVSWVQHFKARMCTRNKHGFINNKSHTSCNKLHRICDTSYNSGRCNCCQITHRDNTGCNITLTWVTWIVPWYAPPPPTHTHLSHAGLEGSFLNFTNSLQCDLRGQRYRGSSSDTVCKF